MGRRLIGANEAGAEKDPPDRRSPRQVPRYDARDGRLEPRFSIVRLRSGAPAARGAVIRVI